jgi:aminoglycoside phosphotransferase family enzyme/predicted kinase
MDDAKPAFIAALRTAYSDCIETHISWVFLGNDQVLKIKKPVRFPFLDFSSEALRRRACEAEVALNRRLSPDVYLGVIALNMQGKVCRDEAEAVDHAVLMRRLPDEQRFDVMLSHGQLMNAHVERLAERIARFHADAEQDRAEDGPGCIVTLRAHVRENLDALAGQLASALGKDEASRLVQIHLQTLDDLAPLLTDRLRQGYVRDGHGDLRLDHVYIDESDTIRVLDCVEFDRAFRVADVCADVAFFAMSLQDAGHPELAERFLARYTRDAGDHTLYRLVDFYMAYWALVRAKVTLARSLQTTGAEREEQAQTSQRFIRLAHKLSCLRVSRPLMLAIGGVIGSGKSRLAENLAEEVCAPLLQSDRLRKQLAGVDVHTRLDAAAYSDTATARLYAELSERAAAILASGRPVVVDASFRARETRRSFRRLAESSGAAFLFVECKAPRAVLEARLKKRETKRGISDARLDLLDDFIARYEPIAEDERACAMQVDTTGEKQATFASVAPSVLALCPSLELSPQSG